MLDIIESQVIFDKKEPLMKNDKCKFDENVLNVYDLNNVDISKLEPGKIQTISGNTAFEYVKKAMELVMKKEIDELKDYKLFKEEIKKYLKEEDEEKTIQIGLDNIINSDLLKADEEVYRTYEEVMKRINSTFQSPFVTFFPPNLIKSLVKIKDFIRYRVTICYQYYYNKKLKYFENFLWKNGMY